MRLNRRIAHAERNRDYVRASYYAGHHFTRLALHLGRARTKGDAE